MYKITPLKQAEISVPLGVVLMMHDMGTLITGPVYVWLIEGKNEKILVDAGMSAPQNGLVHGFPAKGGGEEGLRRALKKVNLKPEDVDKLVITHLHFDHVANVKLFSNARIYIQEKEWKSALNPPLHYRTTYEKEVILSLEKMDLVLVNGDTEIIDGVKLVLLPGHTKGLQGVVVDTEKGKYLIGSDHFYTYLNIFPPKEALEYKDFTGKTIEIPPAELPFLPVGLHVDLSEWYDSCFKSLSYVKRENILPGHDPFLEGKVFP